MGPLKPFAGSLDLVGAVREAYRSGQEDEALEPIVAASTAGRPAGRFRNGDSVIFYDVRGEREVELSLSLTASRFPHFERGARPRVRLATMISYARTLEAEVAFPPQEKIENTLTEVVTKAGIGVAKVAESEKAVHVGYFLNGKYDGLFAGESRHIVPSPAGVSSYASTPGMSAQAVAAEVGARLRDGGSGLVIANLANVDVVGHIENQASALEAVEAVDAALGQVADACREARAALVVTADHGTVEEWLYPDGTINTGHTKNPVPFLLADFSGEFAGAEVRGGGELADIAPSILYLLGIDLPPQMTGRALITGGRPGPGPERPVVLLILDGWGLRDDHRGNLISEARTPRFDALWSGCPHASLRSSGEAVGMPPGTVGNSEAGHLHLGAGRRVLSDRVRIDAAIADGSFFENPALAAAMDSAKFNGRALHLLGIVSHYSSHGTIDHLFALLEMARRRGLENVFIHGLIGRRGERPESGAIYVEKVIARAREIGCGELVTVMGRHWALDREENWDRIEKCYRALVRGEGSRVRRTAGPGARRGEKR
jgi:2,3-bisphosphoglycerate-independent phosphoglycerate mutase